MIIRDKGTVGIGPGGLYGGFEFLRSQNEVLIYQHPLFPNNFAFDLQGEWEFHQIYEFELEEFESMAMLDRMVNVVAKRLREDRFGIVVEPVIKPEQDVLPY